MIEPTAGRSVDVNPLPIVVMPPCVVTLVKLAPSESPLLHPMPVIFSGEDPIFARMNDESRPVAAPGPPTTIPPKSTSAGETDKKGALLTSFPCKVRGREFEYCATALVVEIVRELLLTPGVTDPKDAPVSSLTPAFVRFQVTGKEKVSPALRGPCGSEALETWNVFQRVNIRPSARMGSSRLTGSSVLAPLIFVIPMTAWQLTITVFVDPKVTSPKSMGDVQFSGIETGDPRQINRELTSVT